jgi:N utilization substance protein B
MRGIRKDPRHRAREAALQILYQWEIGRTDVGSAASTFFGLQWADPEPPSQEFQAFATELAHDTVRRLVETDALIAGTVERWRPERMAVLDRLILRMAIAELLRERDRGRQPRGASPGSESVPPAVIINEALELARTFSTEDAVKFINGMLDAVRRKLEAES